MLPAFRLIPMNSLRISRYSLRPRLLTVSVFLLCFLVSNPCSTAQDAKKGENNAKSKTEGQKPTAPGAEKKPEPKKIPSIFVDKALEEAVRTKVYAKRYSDEPITKEDVANLSQIIGSGCQIRDLTGIEHCRDLKLIDLRDNQISDLSPLKELDELLSVTLSGNRIKNIRPLENLTELQLLDVSRNEISDLKATKKMANLRTLYVAENQLESLEPLAELTKIWSLNASGNRLVSVEPVQSLQWLTTLDLRNNLIFDVTPIAKLRSLKTLRLQNNKIQNLQPLLEACKADHEGKNRFAPFLDLTLKGNPIEPSAKQTAIEALRSYGVRVK